MPLADPFGGSPGAQSQGGGHPVGVLPALVSQIWMRSRGVDDGRRCRNGVDQVVQLRRIDQLRTDQGGDETDVLLAAGDEFGDAEIVRFEALRPGVPGVFTMEDLDAVLPSGGQNGRRDLNAWA